MRYRCTLYTVDNKPLVFETNYFVYGYVLGLWYSWTCMCEYCLEDNVLKIRTIFNRNN